MRRLSLRTRTLIISALVAVLIAAVGVYAVIAYAVASRTREIGIRMALGAQASAVLRMIMREGSIMLLSGIVIGLLLSMATAKALSGILYEVSALDPVAFTEAEVYPNPRPGGWDMEQLESLLWIYPQLVGFFRDAARAGNVVLLSFD